MVQLALLAAVLALSGCSDAYGARGLLGARRFVPAVWSLVQTKIQAPSDANVKFGGEGGTIAITLDSTPTVGHLIIIGAASANGCNTDFFTGVTDNQASGGNDYSAGKDEHNDLVAANARYSFITKASGTFTVSITWTDSCAHANMAIVSEFASTGAAPAFDTFSVDSGTALAPAAGTIAPAVTNELFWAVGSLGPGVTVDPPDGLVVPTGYSERGRNWTIQPHLTVASLISTNSSSQTATWTCPAGVTPGEYAGVQLSFRP